MNERTLRVRARFGDGSRRRVLAALGIVVFGAAALFGSAALWRGEAGMRWALLAIVICGAAGLLSWIASRFVRGPQAALWTMLIGMGIRMTAALTACLVVNAAWRNGIESGFGWYLVAAYLIALALDIIFLVNPAQAHGGLSATIPCVDRVGISRGGLSTEGERHG